MFGQGKLVEKGQAKSMSVGDVISSQSVAGCESTTFALLNQPAAGVIMLSAG